MFTIQTSDEDARRRGRNIVAQSLGLLALVTAFAIWPGQTTDRSAGMAWITLATQPLVMLAVLRGRINLGAWLVVILSLLVAGLNIFAYPLASSGLFVLAPLLVASTTLPPQAVWAVICIVFAGTATLVVQGAQPPMEQAELVKTASLALFIGMVATLNSVYTERAFRALRGAKAPGHAKDVMLNPQAVRRQPSMATEQDDVQQLAATLDSAGAAVQREHALHLAHMVAVVANEALTIEEAMHASIQRICEQMGWLAGHAYLPPGGRGELTPTVLWHLEYPERFAVVPSKVEIGRLATLLGLLGPIISTGSPQWIADATADHYDGGGHLAGRLGIRGVFAFPVKMQHEVVVVLEFFSDNVIEPDQLVLDIFAHVGARLGRVIERSRSAEVIRNSEEQLQLANDELHERVNESEHRAREMTLLNDMGEQLNVCHNVAEAYLVVERSAAEIFGGDPGGLWILDPEQDLLEMVARWGEAPPLQRAMHAEECWALKHNRLHQLEQAELGPMCQHLGQAIPAATLCVPLVAQGETFGLLYAGIDQPPAVEINHASEYAQSWSRDAVRSKQRLAVTFAKHVALSLANLRLQETLRLQAIRDPLTGLYNRRYMEEALRREIHRATRTSRPLSVVMLDLDRFKNFNDSFGHPAGDTLLKEVASVIQAQVRDEDTACRYGGEEFALILPNSGLEDARQCAERVREEVRSLHLQHRGQSLGVVTLSLGVATYPRHGATGAAIVQSADTALYSAKHAGRDRVVLGELVEDSGT